MPNTYRTVHILETYDKGSNKEPIVYTEKDKYDAVLSFNDRYEDGPYQLEIEDGIEYVRSQCDGKLTLLQSIDDVFEEWINSLSEDHGVSVWYYESAEEIREDLDDRAGWWSQDCNQKARLRLLELYNDNK